jgi:hypothetical protein
MFTGRFTQQQHLNRARLQQVHHVQHSAHYITTLLHKDGSTTVIQPLLQRRCKAVINSVTKALHCAHLSLVAQLAILYDEVPPLPVSPHIGAALPQVAALDRLPLRQRVPAIVTSATTSSSSSSTSASSSASGSGAVIFVVTVSIVDKLCIVLIVRADAASVLLMHSSSSSCSSQQL